MSTVEDFKNAPVGATATRDDGLLAIKIGDGERRWLTPLGTYLYDDELAVLGYTLDPSAPTTAREALDLAWELAHPIREGQVIPAGTVYLVSRNGERPATMRTNLDQFASKADETNRRTLEPLSDPEPDWLDAPAVLARLDDMTRWDLDERQVFTPASEEEDHWVAMFSALTYHWSELRDVTPLHPKEDA